MFSREFNGDARVVWRGAVDGEELRRRFMDFRQIGKHKAHVAQHLLCKGYGEVLLPSPIAIAVLCPSLGQSMICLASK